MARPSCVSFQIGGRPLFLFEQLRPSLISRHKVPPPIFPSKTHRILLQHPYSILTWQILHSVIHISLRILLPANTLSLVSPPHDTPFQVTVTQPQSTPLLRNDGPLIQKTLFAVQNITTKHSRYPFSTTPTPPSLPHPGRICRSTPLHSYKTIINQRNPSCSCYQRPQPSFTIFTKNHPPSDKAAGPIQQQ